MTHELRCHSCSHHVGVSTEPMRLAGMFKPSLVARLARAHAMEIRKRCSSCGWVNVFHPTRALAREAIELKQSIA